MIEVTSDWYLTLSAILFSIGFLGMMIRKNALIMFMCIELMLNAVNLTFITASNHLGLVDGQIAVFFVLVVAAAEVVVGLAIIVSIFKKQESASVDMLSSSKGDKFGNFNSRSITNSVSYIVTFKSRRKIHE